MKLTREESDNYLKEISESEEFYTDYFKECFYNLINLFLNHSERERRFQSNKFSILSSFIDELISIKREWGGNQLNLRIKHKKQDPKRGEYPDYVIWTSCFLELIYLKSAHSGFYNTY